MVGDKIRFRFRKTGVLRLLSHHDLMRCFERMLRRAAVPFKSTAGFHPTPRLVFALSLPLGVVGSHEVVELELTEPLDAEAVRERLNAQAPVGLELTSAKVVLMKAAAVPRRAIYSLTIPEDRVEATVQAASELMAQPKAWVDRFRPKPRRIDVKPFVRDVRVTASTLSLDLWITGFGSARADEVIRLLGLADLLDAGAVLDRTDLHLHDETPPGPAGDAPPTGPPETAPLDLAAVPAAADDDAATEATWGLSPNGPVVE